MIASPANSSAPTDRRAASLVPTSARVTDDHWNEAESAACRAVARPDLHRIPGGATGGWSSHGEPSREAFPRTPTIVILSDSLRSVALEPGTIPKPGESRKKPRLDLVGRRPAANSSPCGTERPHQLPRAATSAREEDAIPLGRARASPPPGPRRQSARFGPGARCRPACS